MVGRLYEIYDNYYFPGYIDELRVSKGIARWTEAFTPPSVPYPIGASGGGEMGTSSEGQTAIGQFYGTELTLVSSQLAEGLVVIDEGTSSERRVTFGADSGQAGMTKSIATGLQDGYHTFRFVNLPALNSSLSTTIDAIESNGHAPILYASVSSEIEYAELVADLNPEGSGENTVNDVFYYNTTNDSDDRGDLLLKGAV